MSWKTGKYADPILPEGDAVMTIMKLTMEEASGGTPYGMVTARIDAYLGTYDVDDETILDPDGQTIWGKVWLPKSEDSNKKVLGKEQRCRAFLEVLQHAGAVLEAGEDDAPSDVLAKNLAEYKGKSFKASISHSVDESGEYPTRAEINFFRVKRA